MLLNLGFKNLILLNYRTKILSLSALLDGLERGVTGHGCLLGKHGDLSSDASIRVKAEHGCTYTCNSSTDVGKRKISGVY